MKYLIDLNFLFIILIVFSISVIAQKPQKVQHHHAGFDYLKQGEDWVGECATGVQQSPINFVNIPSTCDKSLHINFQPLDHFTPIIISDAHHTIGSNGNFSTLTAPTIDGYKYNYRSLNMHIHTPSEHQINGQSYEMELHIVHTLSKQQPKGAVKPKRDKAVIGIFFQVDDQDPLRDQFLLNWDISQVKTKTQFDFNLKKALQGLLDRKGEVFAYEGSLTTPGCNEIVNWYVYTDPIPISPEQFHFMRQFFKDQRIFGTIGNNRAVQPLNGRKIVRTCKRPSSITKKTIQSSSTSSQTPKVVPPPTSTTTSTIKSPKSQKQAKTSYNYLQKGADWPGVCQTGLEQSPIDIDTSTLTPNCDQGMNMEFKPVNQPLQITMNIGQHPITKRTHYSLASNNKFSYLKATNVDGQVLEYQSMNMHMHSPSEHTVNGINYDLELHLPHQLIDKSLKTKLGLTRDKAVVGIFFQVDDSHPQKDQFFTHWNPIHAKKGTTFNFNFQEALKDIFDGSGEFIAYDGSLTTPGCDEIATWYVYLKPLPISNKQLTFIRSFFTDPKIYVDGNNRVTTPINSRQVKHGGCKIPKKRTISKGRKPKSGKSQSSGTTASKLGAL